CARAHQGRGLVVRRDAERLNWRYADHPEHAYELALARRGGEAVGLAVFRVGAFDGVERVGLVADALTLPGDEAARHALVAWIADRARAAQCPVIEHLLPESSPDWRPFQDASGFLARRLRKRFLLAFRPHSKRLRMHWLRRHWHYTLGDSAFV
ncbi:MAG: hypothetical protein AAFZ65_13680, partial [Planctomycetota bacterium]